MDRMKRLDAAVTAAGARPAPVRNRRRTQRGNGQEPEVVVLFPYVARYGGQVRKYPTGARSSNEVIPATVREFLELFGVGVATGLVEANCCPPTVRVNGVVRYFVAVVKPATSDWASVSSDLISGIRGCLKDKQLSATNGIAQ